MSRRSTKEEFIKKANLVHNNQYDYSKVNYINNKIKVEIICPIHGQFLQRPDNHIGLKQGCRKCYDEKLSKSLNKTLEEFITDANNKHNNKYNYSKTSYTKSIDKLIIICEKHGEFIQEANHHLQGNGCPKCGIEKNTKLPIELRQLVKKSKGVIKQSFIRKNFTKKSKASELLGCSWKIFKIHLENNPYKFSIYDENLDLDHIIPISSAKCEEDVIRLNHYTNYQLLPNVYNRNIKKNKPFNREHFEEWLKYNYNKQKSFNEEELF